jgi:hypothetical protein
MYLIECPRSLRQLEVVLHGDLFVLVSSQDAQKLGVLNTLPLIELGHPLSWRGVKPRPNVDV